MISVIADAPLRFDLIDGWESPSYGEIVPAPVLRVTACAPIARITTTIQLP